MIEPTEEIEETAAERMYKKHLYNVSKYQKNNKEKIGKKQKEYLEKIKEDPVKYKELQKKRHDYYLKVKAATIAAGVVASVVAPEATAIVAATTTAVIGASILINENTNKPRRIGFRR